jgi:DNA-binding PadR family transcriptional regulator
MRVERAPRAAPMHSPVNWALLGLVIQRPSYAYELAHRFERTYGAVLSLSSVSHIYTALAALVSRGFVVELPGTRTGAQPKPHYQATAKGLEDYGTWLVGQVGEDGRRQGLFVLGLSTLTHDPGAALAILDRYEQACLAEAGRTRLARGDSTVGEGAGELSARLLGEERRLALGSKLAWVHYARRELTALSDARARR